MVAAGPDRGRASTAPPPDPALLMIDRSLLLPLLLTLCPGLAAQTSDGTDWPQWRGPDRTGISVESAWNPVGSTEPLWTRSLGLGHSSFAVADGRVFTLGYDADQGLDTVFCLDAATGEELWTHSYPSEIWDVAHDGGALTTPTVVGEVVYTSNREGKVFCFDVADGTVRWERDVRVEKELEPPTWGFSASPLVVDDRVIMNVDRVIAFDRHTGEDVWVSAKGYGISYSTPAPFELDGRSYLAVLSGDGLAVLDRADGSEVDYFEWIKNPQIYPATPVIIGDRIFISAGYERGAAMLRLADGKLEELWSSRIMRTKMSGCVLWEDHLYGFDESILKCIDLDGNQKWRKRGLGTGSMTIAGGRMIILDGKGQLIVAEATPEDYVELSRQDVFDDGTSWSTPILSHGRIYCRSSKGQMACLDYSSAAPTAVVAQAAAAPKEMPAPEALVARHRTAVGGPAALDGVKALRMTGSGESLRNTVRTGSVELDWAAERGFSWKDEAGFQLAFNETAGWTAGGRGGPRVLEGESLDALHEAGDLERLFDPAASYASLGEVEWTVFDNRNCFAVRAETSEGLERTLYFEAETGLLAGHQGEGILMWTLADYRDFDGLMLPTTWAFYEPVKGEMNSAVFDTVVRNPEGADPFAVPEIVQLFMRTPEQIERDNAELTEAHGALLGTWYAEGEADSPPMQLEVRDGFLVFQGERGPNRLTRSEDGGLVMLGAEYVTFTPETDDAGRAIAIQVDVAGEPEVRLVREKEQQAP